MYKIGKFYSDKMFFCKLIGIIYLIKDRDSYERLVEVICLLGAIVVVTLIVHHIIKSFSHLRALEDSNL